MKRIPIAGGAAISTAAGLLGLTWNGDELVFADAEKGILRVNANGGEPQLVAAAGPGELMGRPQILPGNRAVLFTLLVGSTSSDRLERARIVVQSLATGERTVVVDGGSDARYLPTHHIAYLVGSTVFAVPFDVSRLRTVTSPVPVLEGVRRGGPTGNAQLSVSDAGSLVYVPGGSSSPGAPTDLALIDLKGDVQPLNLPPRSYDIARVSPDGKRLAIGSADGRESAIWVYELSGATVIRQVTFGGRNRFPVWSADGVRIAFQSDREGDAAVFWQRADGAGVAERLTKPERGTAHVPQSWTPDGKSLLLAATTGQRTSLWAYSLAEKRAAPVGDIASGSGSLAATLSPDGKWVAYDTALPNGFVVFVQPYPTTGALNLVGAGIQPMWSRDGRQLFWGSGPGQFAVADVIAAPGFELGKPTPLPRRFLSSGPSFQRPFDIMPDGRHVVGPIERGAPQTTPTVEVRVVLHWFDELERRVPFK